MITSSNVLFGSDLVDSVLRQSVTNDILLTPLDSWRTMDDARLLEVDGYIKDYDVDSFCTAYIPRREGEIDKEGSPSRRLDGEPLEMMPSLKHTTPFDRFDYQSSMIEDMKDEREKWRLRKRMLYEDRERDREKEKDRESVREGVDHIDSDEHVPVPFEWTGIFISKQAFDEDRNYFQALVNSIYRVSMPNDDENESVNETVNDSVNESVNNGTQKVQKENPLVSITAHEYYQLQLVHSTITYNTDSDDSDSSNSDSSYKGRDVIYRIFERRIPQEVFYHLLSFRLWSYGVLPLKGLQSIVFLQPSPLYCLASGNVFIDSPFEEDIACLSHASIVRINQWDYGRVGSGRSPFYYWDWNALMESNYKCLRYSEAMLDRMLAQVE